MQVVYIILGVLFICLLAIYIFMSIRLSILSKKKRKIIDNSWSVEDLIVISKYQAQMRVSLKEIFLGIDNGKNSKK